MQQWVIVADAASARIFSVEKHSKTPELVRSIVNPRGRTRRAEIVSAEPGRVYKAGGGVSSAMDPRTDPHEVEIDRFARELAEVVHEAINQNLIHRLALIAPPHFLGLLRKSLGTQAQKMLGKCVAKECTKLPMDDLNSEFAELFSSVV